MLYLIGNIVGFLTKRNILILGACLVVIGGIFMYFEYKNQPQIAALENDDLLIVGTSTASISTTSFSNDWEKTLGEVYSQSQAQSPSNNTDTQKLSATDELGRNLLNQYMMAKQSGEPLSDAEKQQIVASILQNVTVSLSAKTYTEADITVDKNPTDASIRAYGNAMGAILAKHLGGESNITIMQRALNSGTPEGLKEFDTVANRYRAVALDTKALAVPADAMLFHLAYINNLEGMAYALAGIKVIYSDPFAAIASEKAFVQYLTSFEKAKNQLNSYFTSKNIIFSAKETGYFLAGSSQ